MTGGWLLAGFGLLLTAFGSFVAAGAAAPARVELYRWVVQKRAGFEGAAILLSHADRVRAFASAVATTGAVLGGLGAASLLAPLHVSLAVAAVATVAVPMIALLAVGLARSLGGLWSEGIVEYVVPLVTRLPGLQRLTGVETERNAHPPLDSDELSALAGVLEFSERSVREVMTPRTEVVAVKDGAMVADVARLFAESGYSRMPVYRESIDEIIGMIYAFDLLRIEPGAELPVRPVTTVPGSTRCTEVLANLQRERRQFAIVLDEYGGTAGIVTVEDLLEEMIGDIFDEYDGVVGSEGESVELVEISGATPVEDVRGRFATDLPESIETVGGLLAQMAGRIPRAGDRFVVGGLEFDVLSATPTRVERIVVRRGAPVPIESR